jgi:hypothetical protein
MTKDEDNRKRRERYHRIPFAVRQVQNKIKNAKYADRKRRKRKFPKPEPFVIMHKNVVAKAVRLLWNGQGWTLRG